MRKHKVRRISGVHFRALILLNQHCRLHSLKNKEPYIVYLFRNTKTVGS